MTQTDRESVEQLVPRLINSAANDKQQEQAGFCLSELLDRAELAEAELAEAHQILHGLYHTALEIEHGNASGYEIADTIKANFPKLAGDAE